MPLSTDFSGKSTALLRRIIEIGGGVVRLDRGSRYLGRYHDATPHSNVYWASVVHLPVSKQLIKQ